MNKDIQAENQALVDAAIAASGQLASVKVAHCLVGRLGLLSHGYGGGSEDPIEEIEFLLDSTTAFTTAGSSKILVVKAALPISSGSFKVKWCSFEEPWEVPLWSGELVMPRNDGDIPVGSLPMILCQLMMAGDEESIEEAVRDGAPTDEALGILTKWMPDYGDRLKLIISRLNAV
jgi:hypothetical protein